MDLGDVTCPALALNFYDYLCMTSHLYSNLMERFSKSRARLTFDLTFISNSLVDKN